ncbi:hypothetical protein ONZ45_g4480 [Pleurotus djamor]|nr:hypothetical protein ONZ45_g4480 [Pleurotus djamor]
MNLEVGDNDVTADKDYKHVLKRCRNLLLRGKGFTVHGVHVTQAKLRVHLRDHQPPLTSTRIEYLLKPDDKQDVKTAYELLQTVWDIPPSSSTDPVVVSTRCAINTIGRMFRHLTFPYICVDMSLSEQLTHLSSAAHLLFAMLLEDKAGAALMPYQLYTDIMIMIKNAYFCVAKTIVDQPDGKFWLILLGTDRLEVLFGILRTMVGNDANLDVLQLVLRLTGTTEVSTILAKHPEWDRSPRRLQLPALSSNGNKVDRGVDHINPSSWKGDVDVRNVNLELCWEAGREGIKVECPRLYDVLGRLSTRDMTGIDILRPFGRDLVRSSDQQEEDETAENYGLEASGDSADNHRDPEGSGVDVDFEDTIADEIDNSPHEVTFEDKGVKVYKSRYLNQLFREYTNPAPGSLDRTKRVAGMPRHAVKPSNFQALDADKPLMEGSEGESLRLDTPILSLLRCQDRWFLGVGEVNDIVLNHKHHEQLALKYLPSPNAFVSYQLLYLVPATTDDDPTKTSDWKWSLRRGTTYRVPGRLVEPINPQTTTLVPGKPFFLFESPLLVNVGRLLLERVMPADTKKLPEVTATPDFPYLDEHREACFVCEDPKKEDELLKSRQCPRCEADLPWSGLSILDHMAVHILYDKSLTGIPEPCGLCLRSREKCAIYLKKGKTMQIDPDLSTCTNIVTFSYGPASESTTQHPSSNVPKQCHECAEVNKLQIVWKYNLRAHFEEHHPWVDFDDYEDNWKIDEAERLDLRKLWDSRNKKKATRKGKKAKNQLVISERYSTRNGEIVDEEADIQMGAPVNASDDIEAADSPEKEAFDGDDIAARLEAMGVELQEMFSESGEQDGGEIEGVGGEATEHADSPMAVENVPEIDNEPCPSTKPPIALARHDTYNDNPFDDTELREGSRRSRRSGKLKSLSDCTGQVVKQDGSILSV